MKQILLVFLFMASLVSFSQNTTSKCIIKSKDGAPFFLYVNGNLQNKVAKNSVMLKGMDEDAAIKIEFEDTRLGSFQKHIDFTDDNQLFVIEKSKGAYKLKEAGWDDDEMEFSFTASADGINMTIRGNDSDDSESAVSHSSYESSTSSSSYTSSSYTSSSNKYRPNGYNCSSPTLSTKDFKEFERAVKESYFSQNRKEYIYRNIDKYCWMADQIATLVKTLYSDDDQIGLAKYAYNKTFDTENYDVVIDVLSSAKKRIELREWLQGLGRPTPTPNNPRPMPVPDTRNCRGNYFSDSEFTEALRTVEKIPYEESKMNQVDLITKDACLSVSQVRKLVKAFTFEQYKLDVAKKLYALTYEKHKYYLVNEEFTFDYSKTALTEFIKSQGQ